MGKASVGVMGKQGHEHLISKRPQPAKCFHCQQQVLVGLDEGWSYMLDPIPLTFAGEFGARLCGRSAYGLNRQGYFQYRGPQQIAEDQTSARPIVLAVHACGRPLVEGLDPSGVGHVQRIIRRAKQVADPALMRAEFTIMDVLKGRVIKQGPVDKPPF